MKKLDNIIKESFRAEEEPYLGHEQRFAEKLCSKESQKRRIALSIISTGVAAMLLVVVALLLPTNTEPAQPSDDVCEFVQYCDLSMYQIENEIIDIAQKKMSKEEVQQIMNDINGVYLDYTKLKELQNGLPAEQFQDLLYQYIAAQRRVSENLVANLGRY